VPYIPAWELYQQRGYERLKKLLASSRYEEPNLSAPFDFRHIPALMREGLMETVTHFNPKRYTDIIESEAEAFRRLFGWDAEREIGIWMHLGIYTDQLLNRQRTPTQELNTPSTVAGTKLPQGHVEIWNKLLFLLEKTFHVRYPPATAHEMARLSNAP
jgi:transcriptional regulatory protein LevR